LRQLCIEIDKQWDIFTSDMEVRIMKDYSLLSQKFMILFSSKYVYYVNVEYSVI